ncbi:phosphoribosylformylglycinamidine synthase subunit PurL, partial [bacterium]
MAPGGYREMGLTDGEWELIVTMLGREPNRTETGMFAVMWSEHCGYKYSRPVLAAFAEYKKAMAGDGLENAGVVDIGNGLGVTMKVESHNHPSAVEPYQGAATGVGGIIRDILTMGARPVALLNSLRFGPVRDGEAAPEVVGRNKFLLEHVVAGIAGYGNCVGVPTVGGEIDFHPLYSGNPLVNAMCAGVLRLDEVTTAAAKGVGNPVIYLGSSTGRDGIHGATFASEALDEDSDAKRPNVQIGDPFAEKSLIEATLEALATGAIVSIQDMGAAGLTCSTIEMAAKGHVGMEIDLDLVPMRENDMTGYELMLSESQERMMCVATKGREEEVLAVFRKWELPAVVVGTVTAEPRVVVRRWGQIVADVDPHHLADECPVYASTVQISDDFQRRAAFDPTAIVATDPRADLLALLASPTVASKRPVFEQYDRHVMTGTVVDAGKGDAAVIHPEGTERAISLALDGNSRWTAAHPRRGGRLAIAEAARNVACTGARPVAVTDGLNYGDPTDPQVFWAFRESVYGLAEAADLFG